MKYLKQYIVPLNSTIKQTISCLEATASQIVLVVSNQKLKGTVTDGDIRRALLKGETLDSEVKKIMNKNFKFLSKSATEKDALKLMKKEILKQIPILDKKGKILDLFLLDELIKPKFLPNEVIIMAGGKGERLGTLTKDCPKPMLKINKKPILEIILNQCLDAGFKKFHFSVNYLKGQIKSHFKDGSYWNVNINYLQEKKPLGTAGSLSLLPKKTKKPFLIINGDVLTKIDYGQLLQFHNDHKAVITICVREIATKIPYGVVGLDDLNVINLEEKPILTHFVNAGIYVVEPKVIDLLPKNTKFDMTELISLVKKNKYLVNAFPVHEYWKDIGYPETLLESVKDWK
jgi:dTDP-glucose pyrophosphorylase